MSDWYSRRSLTTVLSVLLGMASLVVPVGIYYATSPTEFPCTPATEMQASEVFYWCVEGAALLWAITATLFYWLLLQRQVLLGNNLARIGLSASVPTVLLVVLVPPFLLRYGSPCVTLTWVFYVEVATGSLLACLLAVTLFSWSRRRMLRVAVEKVASS